LLGVALIFGLVNAIIRPVLGFLTIPIQIVTLGLFTFVLNAIMLLITSGLAGAFDLPFRVDGFIPALLGSLVISIVSVVLSGLFGRDE
jgi:putative membrane protein